MGFPCKAGLTSQGMREVLETEGVYERATAPFLGNALMNQHNNPAFRSRLGCPCGSPQKPFPLVTAVLSSDSQSCEFVFTGREK